MSIKIISNGTSAGTRVYNSDGHEIAGITDIIIDPMSARDSPVTATLKFMAVELDIQPWQFGHGETKKTGLWLKNLPLLQPTDIVEGRENRVHRMQPGPDRWKERSRTLQGIATAMANQWGSA